MKNLFCKLFFLVLIFNTSCRKDEGMPVITSTNLDGKYKGTATTLVKHTGQTMAYPVRIEIGIPLWLSNTNKEDNPFHLQIVPDPNPGHLEGQVLLESAVTANNTIVTFWSYQQDAQSFSGQLSSTNHLASRSYIVFQDPGLGQPYPYYIDPQAALQGGLDNDSLTIEIAGFVKDYNFNKIEFNTKISAKKTP